MAAGSPAPAAGAAGAAASSTLPELRRVCVLPDGRAKATFSDNTLLVTNSTGSAFLVTSPDGQSVRQVSEFALARHSPRLAAVLEFRNMHVELPSFCKPLARLLRPSFRLGYLVADATWPADAAVAVQASMASMQPDGRTVVSSEDGVAQVVLHSHRRRFAVCYPLLVAEHSQAAQYEYVWQTQVFSTASHPPRWQPAVHAALQAAALLHPQAAPSGAALASGDLLSPLPPPLQQQQHAASSSGDGAPGSAGAGALVPLLEAGAQRRTVMPRADDCMRAGLTEQLRSDDWWGAPSLSLLPPDEVVLLEWTPDATYQFLPEAEEVEAWLHADESCLLTVRSGRFVAHCKGPAGDEQLYAAHCVPDAVYSADKALRYPLAALAAHALKLRAHNLNVAAAAAARSPCGGDAWQRHTGMPHALATAAPGSSASGVLAAQKELFAVHSEAVLEESVVPGQGHFLAYEDGRVRVRFEDRAVLHMAASHSHCKVVLPEGHVVVVATANPVSVEAYVAAAMQFAHWAFKTPAERSEELRAQARVRAELCNSHRMAQLCEYATVGAVPGSGATGLGSGEREGKAECGTGLGRGEARVGEGGALDMQAMVERVLRDNAQLLGRL